MVDEKLARSKYRLTIVFEPPYEVNQDNPYEVTGANGNIICTTWDPMIAEELANILNEHNSVYNQPIYVTYDNFSDVPSDLLGNANFRVQELDDEDYSKAS